MNALHTILKQYWGYDEFRPLQEDIIRSVIEGNDTLALLPTGGGKSICFQVPALYLKGLCLVISPLIALMKDQVENLKKRKIAATYLHAGLSFRETEVIEKSLLQNEYQFLYVSPERLQSEAFLSILKKLPVQLIAVDEAHCISQWGYDFRPPYLRIAEIRTFFPHIPIIALTATATPPVIEDIMEKLKFRQRNVFVKSFERKNLSYAVKIVEDKHAWLLNILKKITGSAIVYVRNRKKTKEWAAFLEKQGISADFYHAGLSTAERNKKQQAWMSNKTRVIVATNAFGMGIDKPDVRLVIHLDLPDTLESYFQEAGRAGRDEKKAYAIILINQADILNLEKSIEITFPSLDFIRKVYDALGNYLQIPIYGGLNQTFPFNMEEFASRYSFKTPLVYSALKILEKNNYIYLNEYFSEPSKIHFLTNSREVYKIAVKSQRHEALLMHLSRNYPGIFSAYVPINELYIASQLKASSEIIQTLLHELESIHILDYIPASDLPKITYTEERTEGKKIIIRPETYALRKKQAQANIQKVIEYVRYPLCRTKFLLDYFGQKNYDRCETCDNCLRQKKQKQQENIRPLLINEIYALLPSSQSQLLKTLVWKYPETFILDTIQWLAEERKIEILPHGKIKKASH